MTQNIILTHQEIVHKTRRIAYQIYETFSDENELVIAGISNSGFIFAQKINEEFQKISTLKITLCEVQINKQNPSENIITSITAEEYTNKNLILIDDVLNSGAT